MVAESEHRVEAEGGIDQSGFRNARYARNLFEQAVNRQALRLDGAGLIDINRDELLTLCRTDIEEAARLV